MVSVEFRSEDKGQQQQYQFSKWYLCVKEPITSNIRLLPFDSCDEPKGIQLGFQLHKALQTKRDNKEV